MGKVNENPENAAARPRPRPPGGRLRALRTARHLTLEQLSRMAGVQLSAHTGGPIIDQRCATSREGIYAAGNVVHVYDLVDDVTESALVAGRYAAKFAREGPQPPMPRMIPVSAGRNVRHVVPQHLRADDLGQEECFLELRARAPVEETVRVQLSADDRAVYSESLRYVRPSEMVRLKLEPELGRELRQAQSLRVDLVERQ